MGLSFKIKHHFFSAFRELFLHHHGSLEFRAKIFALIISANQDIKDECYTIVKDIGMIIYKNDAGRANQLMLTTQELVQKVKNNNGLDIDNHVENIKKEIKIITNNSKKIKVK